MATKPTTTTTSSKSKSTTSRKTTVPAAKRTTTKTAAKPATADAVSETSSVVALAALRKRELIDKVIERSGAKKKYAKPAIEAMIDVLGEALAEGRELNLQPMGRFKTQRSKDTSNARIIIAKIRQSKAAQPAFDPADKADAENANEKVAEPAD